MAPKLEIQRDRFSPRDIVLNYGIIIAAIALVVILSVFADNFLTVGNLLNLLRQSSIIGIVALAGAMVILTGGIDLSAGSVVGFSAAMAASFAAESSGQPMIVAILVGIGIGILCGLGNGFAIAYGNIPPFIVTLGMMGIARGAILVYNGGRPITGFTIAYKRIGTASIAGVPVITIVFIVAIILVIYLMTFTKFGREIYAVGDNEDAALVSGISIKAVKLKVYTFAGFLMGVAGVLWAARMQAATSTAAEGYEMDAIAAAVIGGVSLQGGIGKIPGVVLGVFILGIITNGLDMLGTSPYYKQIIKGLVIILAVWLDSQKKR